MAKTEATPGIGHNSDDVGGKRLRSFLERIERLEEEKAGLSEDIKEIYAEAKGTGFDPKIMRKLVALRRMDEEKRRNEFDLLQLYAASIGMGLFE